MLTVLSVIVILTISIIVNKIATAMLVNTGLSTHLARFQARSAFSGSGFTTRESEQVVRHPIRRRIIFHLMLLGNAGIVTVMASILLTFVNHDEKFIPWYYNLGIIIVAIVILSILSSSNRIDAWLTKMINKILGKYTNMKNKDFSSLYKLSEDYHIIELEIQEGDWVAEKTMKEASLKKEGISILGIERSDSTYVGVPGYETVIHVNDILILYGTEVSIKQLDHRKANEAGDTAHKNAVVAHTKEMQKQVNTSVRFEDSSSLPK